MANYIKVEVKLTEMQDKEILLALLAEQGFEGFEETAQSLLAYIPEEQYNQASLSTLLQDKDYSLEKIWEQNWNALWEKDFKPVAVNHFCYIRAVFHPPAEGYQQDIVITPKMSFGTGHHATTWLVIDQMEALSFQNQNVLDFGTGTGILAILAERLGAATVVAVDNDDWSMENAKENAMVNNCRTIEFIQADSLTIGRTFGIILANINRHVLLANMKSMEQHLASDGVLILSGLLSGDLNIMEKSALNEGLHIVQQKEKDGWMVLKLAKS
jgi:ribosomal protein L11 methyltransferase